MSCRELMRRLTALRVLIVTFGIALTVWGLTDVRYRSRLHPERPEKHSTDLTVYTTAGAAFYDDTQDPYEVTNPWGWHYLYPPIFSLLVAPLSPLPTQWQAVVWHLICMLLLLGCYVKGWRLVSGLASDAAIRPLPRWVGS